MQACEENSFLLLGLLRNEKIQGRSDRIKVKKKPNLICRRNLDFPDKT